MQFERFGGAKYTTLAGRRAKIVTISKKCFEEKRIIKRRLGPISSRQGAIKLQGRILIGLTALRLGCNLIGPPPIIMCAHGLRQSSARILIGLEEILRAV